MSNYEATRLTQPVKPTPKPAGKGIRFLKWAGKVAGATVIATITACLLLLLLFGGLLAGVLNSVKAESSAADDTGISQEDFPEFQDDPSTEGDGQAVGPPQEESATVLLEGNSSGPATVSWNTPGSYGNTYDLPEGGPWELEIPEGERDGSYSVTVSSEDYENASTVSCKITVDKTVPSDGQSQADGVGAIADCNTN